MLSRVVVFSGAAGDEWIGHGSRRVSERIDNGITNVMAWESDGTDSQA